MTIWAVVPVKAFRDSKSRLAGTVSPAFREALARELLTHTLAVIQACRSWLEGAVVVSPDPGVLRMAREHGAHGVLERGREGLNSALDQGAAACLKRGGSAILIVPADLPAVEPASLDTIRDLLGPPPSVVIAPDVREAGTNALAVRPPGLLRFAFGQGSFGLHLEQARALGAGVQICRRRELAADLDLPEDLPLAEGLLARMRAREGPR